MFKGNYNLVFRRSFLGVTLLLALGFIPHPIFAEEGGGGGVLQGLAAITAAATPAVVAGIQADANKKIAGINAQNSVDLTNIQADVTKYQATTQAQTSLFESLTALKVNENNNKGQTERLGMQLAQLSYERQLARESEIEKRKIELNYRRQEIALQFRQEEDRFQMEMAKINAAKVQAGLASGFVSVGSSLTTSKAVSMNGLASGSTRAFKKRSDLAGFQDSMRSSRAIASNNEAGLVRHARRDRDESSGESQSHSSGRSSGVFSIGR